MYIPDIFNDYHILDLVEPVYNLKSFIDVVGTINKVLPHQQWLSVSHFRKAFQVIHNRFYLTNNLQSGKDAKTNNPFYIKFSSGNPSPFYPDYCSHGNSLFNSSRTSNSVLYSPRRYC